ncbi:MAG: 4Fe-4S binding protein [archaeon]
MVSLIKERCPSNHPCPLTRACPQNAITQVGFSAPSFDKNKCIGCNICVNNCPYSCFVK